MKFFALLCLLSINSYAGIIATSFEEAKVIAIETEGDPKYSEYHSNVIMSYFGKKYSTILKYCFIDVKNPDASSFELVVALDESGDVKSVFKDIETNIGKCMLKELETDKFPKPMTSPYYIHLGMSFRD